MTTLLRTGKRDLRSGGNPEIASIIVRLGKRIAELFVRFDKAMLSMLEHRATPYENGKNVDRPQMAYTRARLSRTNQAV